MASPSSSSASADSASRPPRAVPPPAASRWSRHLREAARLVLPVSCAGCGRWDVELCPDCRSLLAGAPASVEHAEAAGTLEVRAVAAYAGPVRHMVLGWKNGAREDLTGFMDETGIRAGRLWARSLDEETRTVVGAGPLLVVPAPSGWLRRARGRLVAAPLADAVARGAAAGWPRPGGAPRGGGGRALDVLSADLLRRPRFAGGAHQAGRSARQRRINRADPPRVLAPVSGLAILLVDDVVTTGATLGACARALRDAGARVIGALVVAATPPPIRRRGSTVPGGPVPEPDDQIAIGSRR